jgi:hypothetical protein
VRFTDLGATGRVDGLNPERIWDLYFNVIVLSNPPDHHWDDIAQRVRQQVGAQKLMLTIISEINSTSSSQRKKRKGSYWQCAIRFRSIQSWGRRLGVLTFCLHLKQQDTQQFQFQDYEWVTPSTLTGESLLL